MSDSDFVDIGDELVVRIGGYPVGKAVVKRVNSEGVVVYFDKMVFDLLFDFKDHDIVDGVAHELYPPILERPEPIGEPKPEVHECYCGRKFNSWRDLYDHKVGFHGWGKEDN